MPDFTQKAQYTVYDLRRIVALLRAPGGCPWDGAQTHESIRRNFIEEAYEVAEAIDEQSPAHLKEELGDVLLQVVFHASLEEDAGRFDLDDVADGICKKLIFRHPHVFGDVQADTSQQVLANWDGLKRREKGQRSTADAVEAVPHTLPALWRAEKIVSRSVKAGFNWDSAAGALDKLDEETAELRQAVEAGQPVDSPHGIREELGDALFILCKIAQMSGVDPEDALNAACEKFIRRYAAVEQGAAGRGVPVSDLTLAEMTDLWNGAKQRHDSDGF